MVINPATIIGRNHRLMQQNCQDTAVAIKLSDEIAFGLVFDGCGSKHKDKTGTFSSHNEVGAHLLGAFAAAFLRKQLTMNRQHTPITNQQLAAEVVAQLYQACVTYLDCLVSLHPFTNEAERRCFIATNLLSTIVGFVVTPQTAVCFWSGDGTLCINGELISLDSNNRPEYLAYQLLGSEGNGRFNQLTIHQRNQLEWLAVATDGWKPDYLAQLDQPRPAIALQRWINVAARQREQFEDDGAVVVWHAEKH
jgi:hypothetical protein